MCSDTIKWLFFKLLERKNQGKWNRAKKREKYLSARRTHCIAIFHFQRSLSWLMTHIHTGWSFNLHICPLNANSHCETDKSEIQACITAYQSICIRYILIVARTFKVNSFVIIIIVITIIIIQHSICVEYAMETSLDCMVCMCVNSGGKIQYFCFQAKNRQI